MTRKLETLPLDKIGTGTNVRDKIGSVRELAASLDSVGLLNPLTVRRFPGGAVELIAGHRRLEAARSLGWETIDVYVLEGVATLTEAGKADRLAVQLVENLQREDLAPLEEAEGLASLAALLGSQKAAAEAVGRSQAHVSKRLKLRELPDEARAAVDSGAVSLEDAFELTKLDDKAAAKVARSFVERPGGAHYDLSAAKRDAERKTAAEKAAKAYAKEHPGVEVTAKAKSAWKTLEGWNGLAVDEDAHKAEPCHRVVVGYSGSWDPEPRAIFYCAEPARHDADGESDVKVLETDADANAAKLRAESEKRRQKAEEQRARIWAEAVTIAGDLSDRNAALKVLARFILEAFADEDGDLGAMLEALGVTVPAKPEKPSWEDRPGWDAYAAELRETLDGLSVADSYRAAVLYVLTSTTHAPWAHSPYGEELTAAVAGLLSIELPERSHL